MVKQRMPKISKLKDGRIRSWKRSQIFTVILVLFGITQVTFVLTWHYGSPTAKRNGLSLLRNTEGNGVSRGHRKLAVLMEFKGTSEELSEKLKTGFGGHILIDYSDGNIDDQTIIFDYFKASPKVIDFSKLQETKKEAQKPKGYVQVHSRYWEQLTMNLRSFISLVGQAGIGERKVVEPRVQDSVFGRTGHPLGTYFDLNHFNNILASSNYRTLASQSEYNSACSMANASRATIYFLFPKKGIDFTKRKLGLTDVEYNEISSKASVSGWTECKALTNFIKESANAPQYCVEPSKITEWEKLEKDVIKGAKCLTIAMWRGIGGGFRTMFNESRFKIKARDIQFALKPPWDIVKEAKRFQNTMLHGRYIAVQVRGERVVIPHDLNRLRSCLRLLAEVVSMLKELSDITQVLIASDMSDFGSASWKDSLAGEVYNDNTLNDLQNFLMSSTGGIEYKPSSDDFDHGVVALTEMFLISQAQHLITVGMGSFQEWIKTKFLENHHSWSGPTWSLIALCSK